MLRTLSVLALSALLTLTLALPASAADYTVRRGDTLSTIAARQGVSGGWRALYDANRATVANPNVIRVGQTLRLPTTSPRRTTSSSTVSRSSTRSSTASSTSSTTSAAGARIVAAARSQIGTPYRWGGASTSGFDCSGLTSWAHARAGVTIPRSSRAQFAAGTRVSNPQPGDLVGFYSPISHVGIYTGNGMMVHASRPGRPVAEVPVFSSGLRGYVRLH